MNTSSIGVGKPFNVAIIGSGPSGFYAAEALLKSKHNITTDVYEKLPVPFGLVRFGVAPDHPKLKMVEKVFSKIAHMQGFRFIGNVQVGKDVSVQQLTDHYHAVIFAYGTEIERSLKIEGEDLDGSHSAREFVAWYNGHPEYSHKVFDFSGDQAVIIGQGNVALDVARILLKTQAELKATDIADYALDALSKSNIKHIHIVGRRGPAQSKFSAKELREFGDLQYCNVVVKSADFSLNQASKTEINDNSSLNIRTNLDFFRTFFTQKNTRERACIFDFFKKTTSIDGIKGRVNSITFQRTKLEGRPFFQKAVTINETETLSGGLVFKCIGYKAKPIEGLFYDDAGGILNNENGRLKNTKGVMSGLYATGWVKQGPSGTIGTNRGDSVQTVEVILEDFGALNVSKQSPEILINKLLCAGKKLVSFSDWEALDRVELSRGRSVNKSRQKITTINEMLDVIEVERSRCPSLIETNI
ncbi:MAG: FAD-dependent oxidoreductase [Paraglaciecola sp.]|nr:FAD-dependent oxidoreductase [Paraglaciecola sp.]